MMIYLLLVGLSVATYLGLAAFTLALYALVSMCVDLKRHRQVGHAGK